MKQIIFIVLVLFGITTCDAQVSLKQLINTKWKFVNLQYDGLFNNEDNCEDTDTFWEFSNTKVNQTVHYDGRTFTHTFPFYISTTSPASVDDFNNSLVGKYNKEHARLASIKDKQHFGDKPAFRQNELARKRKRLINDYISKACRIVINYCLLHNIGKLVCGYNVTFQHNSDIGRVYSIYASFTELNIMSRKRAIRV